MHYTSAFGHDLFPHWHQTREMLHTIEAFLDEKDKKGDELPALLRKQLIEQADDLKRILPILEKQQAEASVKG